jgi:hypothetical protein
MAVHNYFSKFNEHEINIWNNTVDFGVPKLFQLQKFVTPKVMDFFLSIIKTSTV